MRGRILVGAAAVMLAMPVMTSAQGAQDARSQGSITRSTPPPSDTGTPAPGSRATQTGEGGSRSYPVCGPEVQDNCQNPGEGGAPGQNRALDYWPGEPASEIRARNEPLPPPPTGAGPDAGAR